MMRTRLRRRVRVASSRSWRDRLISAAVLTGLIAAAVFTALAVAAVASAPVARAADSGDLLWDDILAASVSDDEWTGIGAAPDGGVYAVGTADVFDVPRASMVLARYAADGTRVYAHYLHGGVDRHGFGSDLVVDDDGAVIAVGVSEPPGSGGDLLVVKYDAAGDFEWQAVTSLTGGSDHATCVDVDSSGNVYVAGHDGWSRIVLVKYDANGVEKWRRAFEADGDYAEAYDVAVDAAGAAYVVGEAIRPDTTSDFALLKWTASGRLAWSRIFDGRGGDDVLRHVHLWGASTVYVAGRFGASPSRDTGYVAKYTSGGTRTWQRTVFFSRGSAWVNSIDVDGYGRLTAAGGFEVSAPVSHKAYVKRWSADGTTRWTVVYYGVRNRRGATWGPMTCDSRGRVWCAGEIRRAGTDVDWLVARYSTSGQREWIRAWGPAADAGYDGTSAICLGFGGSLYVAGSTDTTTSGVDLVVRKYDR